jgi:hypothetical protein
MTLYNVQSSNLPGTTMEVVGVDGNPVPLLVGDAAAGSVSNVTASAPITSSGGDTPNIAIVPAADGVTGSMSGADKTKLDGIAPGAAVAGVGANAPLTVGGTAFDPIIQLTGALAPATLVGVLYVDPQNSSGVATHTPTGFTGTLGFGFLALDWADFVAVWGSVSPVINTATTVLYLSGHTDNTDPMIWTPYVGKGVLVQILGTLTQVSTGVLGAVTAKARATNVLLQAATLPGSPAASDIIVNATRANSRAMLYKAAGAVWTLCQPFAAVTMPANINPAEVDTWATGDSVTIFSSSLVNLVRFEPQVLDEAAGGSLPFAYCYVRDLTVYDPTAGAPSTCFTNTYVRFFDCVCQRMMAIGGPEHAVNSGFASFLGSGFNNCALLFGFETCLPSEAENCKGFIGGYVSFVGAGASVCFDGDMICNADLFCTGGFNFAGCVAMVGFGALTANPGSRLRFLEAAGYGSAPFLYGTTGTTAIPIISPAHVQYPAAAAVATFPLTATHLASLDFVTTGSSIAAGAINSGIALTAASLDAAAGAAGFGGLATNFAGAAIAGF